MPGGEKSAGHFGSKEYPGSGPLGLLPEDGVLRNEVLPFPRIGLE